MAKRRYIKDSFRSDNWIETLDPLERYLYLYLLTNEYVNCCGIYEIRTRRIAFETGLEEEIVKKLIARFQEAEKVYYNEGVILIVNFVKNQSVTSTSDNLWKGIVREVRELGENKIKKVTTLQGAYKVVEGTYKDVGIPYFTLLNLTLPNEEIEAPKVPSKKTQENPPVKIDYTEGLERFIESWNIVKAIDGKKGFIKCKGETEGIKKVFKPIYKKYGKEGIIKAVESYIEDIKRRDPNDSYGKHRFSLYDFLKQNNAFNRFYNI